MKITDIEYMKLFVPWKESLKEPMCHWRAMSHTTPEEEDAYVVVRVRTRSRRFSLDLEELLDLFHGVLAELWIGILGLEEFSSQMRPAMVVLDTFHLTLDRFVGTIAVSHDDAVEVAQ